MTENCETENRNICISTLMSSIVSGVALDGFSATMSIKHSGAAQNHKTIPTLIMMMMMTKMTKVTKMAMMTKVMIFIFSLVLILLFVAIYKRVDAKNKEDFEKRDN